MGSCLTEVVRDPCPTELPGEGVDKGQTQRLGKRFRGVS